LSTQIWMGSIRLVSSRRVPLHVSDPLDSYRFDLHVCSNVPPSYIQIRSNDTSIVPLNEWRFPIFLGFITLPPRQVESPKEWLEAQSLQRGKEIKKYQGTIPRVQIFIFRLFSAPAALTCDAPHTKIWKRNIQPDCWRNSARNANVSLLETRNALGGAFCVS